MVDGGNVAFDAILHQNNSNFNQEAFLSSMGNVLERLDDYSRMFIDKARDINRVVTSSRVAQIARNAIRQAAGILNPDVITVIPVNKLHEANALMQRWIMAEPTIRELYIKDRCDGFYGTYTDMFEGDIGEDHYDYRRVTDGVLQYPEDSDSWLVQFHTEELLNERDQLSVEDKDAILETWENVKLAVAAGKDPTNPDGGYL